MTRGAGRFAVLVLVGVLSAGCSLTRFSAGEAPAAWGDAFEADRPEWANVSVKQIRWPRIDGFDRPGSFELDGPVLVDTRWERTHQNITVASETSIQVGRERDRVRIDATPSVLVASYPEPNPVEGQSIGRRGAVVLWTEREHRRFAERELRERLLSGEQMAAELATAFVLRLPEGGPKAIALRISGLDGGIYDRSIETELLARGYAVLVIRPPALGGLISALAGDSSGSVDEPAWATVMLFDRFFSARALSTLGLVEWMEAEVPALAGAPVVIVASSFGAITAPTTAVLLRERLGERLRSQVLIAGGANLIDIMRTSAYGIAFAPERTERQRLRWAELHAARSRFDPLNTAPMLRGPMVGDLPTLVIHATDDGIVPARTQIILWERLGKPERWDFSGGHVALFLLFERWAGGIADWVDGRLDGPAGRDGAASARIIDPGGL